MASIRGVDEELCSRVLQDEFYFARMKRRIDRHRHSPQVKAGKIEQGKFRGVCQQQSHSIPATDIATTEISAQMAGQLMQLAIGKNTVA